MSVIGALIQHDAAREQRIGIRGKKVEIGDVPIIRIEIVYPKLLCIHVKRRIRVIAPVGRTDINPVEKPVLWIQNREVGAQ